MSNSIYRLLMRWVRSTLYPILSPHLQPRQFGGKQRSYTAHATQAFLEDLDNIGNLETILAFDVYHAFDSPPKPLIYGVLDRLGTPSKLLRSIFLVLEKGATYLRGAETTVFRTTHGVKQGCPLSCFLFVIVFEIFLRYLQTLGVSFSAYVDDIATPTPKGHSQSTARAVQHALSLIACQTNVIKSEMLPLSRSPPAPPALPKYIHPPTPVQAMPGDLWSSVPAGELPDWSSQVTHTFARSACFMHLVQPIPAYLSVPAAFKVGVFSSFDSFCRQAPVRATHILTVPVIPGHSEKCIKICLMRYF